MLRSASNYIPPFLKFIITTKVDVPKEKGRSKLYYITKMLGTQKVVTVSDEDILAAEGAQFRELALASFDPTKDAQNAEQIEKRVKAMDVLKELNSRSYRSLVEFVSKLTRNGLIQA